MAELSQKEVLKEFEPIFYPRSITVVDFPQNTSKAGSLWLKAIVAAGFSGNTYLVNPCGSEFLGLKSYLSLREIPEAVDYVIVSMPLETIPSLLDDCAAKKVKAVHFFTSGLNDTGDNKVSELRKELVRKARQGDFRIIGPDCIGVYCPESKVPYGTRGKIGKVGSVGFISQSDSIGEKLVELEAARGINYSKGISFGDGIDLDSADFIEYMGVDPKTSFIGVYLEGDQNSRRLLKTISKVARIKPLIVWKGDSAEVRTSVIMSHGGFSASSAAIWSAAVEQAGAIEVHSLEELGDTLLIFQQLHRWRGDGVAVIGGLADGGGGICVSASDTCAEIGLSMPPLSTKTRQKLISLLGQVGTIFCNPVDVGQAGGDPILIRQAMELVLADSSVDLVIVQEDTGILLRYLPWESVKAINAVIADLRTTQDKPIAVVLPPDAERERFGIEQELSQVSIPVFPSMGRAAKAVMNLSRYCHLQVAERG